MPRRKRNEGDIDGHASSPQPERTTETRTTFTTGTSPRKSKRTRIVSPTSTIFPNHEPNDSASSLDEETTHSLSNPSTRLPSTEHEAEAEPESSIPPHIRRLIKGKQVQRHTSSGSGFIDMTSHAQSLPADSDTDESSFWSAGDTSLSSTSSALLSDTSMSVRMDVVRFDWPSSSSFRYPHGHVKQSYHEIQAQKIHRVRSAPNLSPDRFIPRHSAEDDTLLHRSSKSTPRSVRLARHLGFVIGDAPPANLSEGKFEERLRRARRQSNASMADEATEENISFARRAMRAGAGVELEQPSAGSSTRLGTPSTRSISPARLIGTSSGPGEHSATTAARRDASPNPFHLHHSASESSLYHTASRLSLGSSTPLRVSSPATSFRASTPAPSTSETSLRQLPHERALLLRSASSALSHTLTVGASGAAMSLGMDTRVKRRGTGGKPSPSSRYHMQRAPIHVYDAPEILEDYYASPFAWNHSTQDQFSTSHPHTGTPSLPSLGSTSTYSENDYPGGMLACALGASVFFSRVSGSRLLCIERLCTAESGSGIQSAVEWGTHTGGWEHALAVGQTKGALSVWDARTKQHILALRSSSSTSHSTRLSNSPSPSQVCAISWNRNLLAAGLNGCALLWDMRCAPRLAGEAGVDAGGEAFRLGAHGAHKVCGVKWREDGEMLATGGDDNIVCVWDVRMPRRPAVASESGEAGGSSAMPVGRTPMWRKRRHTGAVKALAWCPWAPNVLASGGGKQDGTICFWNVQTGTLKETLALGSQITSIAFSPVCREFVTTHGFRAATSPPLSSNPPQPARFQTYNPHPPSSDPDSATPLLQDTANSIVTHAYPSLARVAHVPNLHGMRISHASLSPDGSRLMTGGTFEALVMWSVWGAVGREVEEGIGSAVGMIR